MHRALRKSHEGEKCDDENCDCHHHHHHDEKEHHDHHHEHGEECSCGCHDHDHHHHHADEVFKSFGYETVNKYTKEELENILETIENDSSYGTVLRAKGIIEGEKGWLHFDYVPGETNVREGSAGVIGRLCVIGKDLNVDKLKKIFRL